MVKIESIEYVDEEVEMCDIEVDDVNCYLAEGVTVHNSREPIWLEAFQSENGDPHKATAIKLFGEENYDRDKRKKAKILNFGLLYGMSKYSVKDTFDMDSIEEAEKFVNQYKNTLSTLFAWEDRVKKKARKKGVVYTYFNRPRRLRWYFNHEKSGMRAFAYRSAINSPIQGCHPYETRVLTDEGYICIGEIKEKWDKGEDIPEKVWTGKNFAEYIPMDMGEKQLYKVKTKSGREIECDLSHKFKEVTDEGYKWESVENLNIGDSIAINMNSIDRSEKERKGYKSRGCSNWSNDFEIDSKDYDYIFYLMGYITGDGFITEKKREDTGHYRRNITISFGEHEVDKMRKMKSKLESFGLRVSERKGIHKPKNKVSTRYVLVIRSKGFIEFLKDLGMEPNKYCYDKRVPYSVWEGSYVDIYWFLKGLHDSDGAERDGSLHLQNKKILKDVQILISQFGFDSHLFKTSIAWKLNIRDSKSYLKFIKGGEVKRLVGKQIYKQPPKFLKDEFIDKIDKGLLETGTSSHVVYHRVKNGGSSSVSYMERMLSEQDKKFDILYWEDEIVDIEKLDRKETVYTLSVADEKHQYVAEGFISKNCGSDILKIAIVKLWKNLLNHEKYKDDIYFASTVHDEINFYVRKNKLKEIIPLIKNCMELEVPGWPVKMEADVEIGSSWGHLFEFEYDEEEGDYVPVIEPVDKHDM